MKKHVHVGCSNPNCGYSVCRIARKKVIEDIMCSALNLSDVPMTPEQRAISDEIYTLANRLEGTFDE